MTDDTDAEVFDLTELGLLAVNRIGYEAATPTEYETVDHPAHYTTRAGVECIDVVESMTFNVGNAVKYLWRIGRKPGETEIEALKKAQWYIQREIERLGRA